ncbi:MAG: glycosyltransferase family 2 protein, partial [Usitatibacter sp.]
MALPRETAQPVAPSPAEKLPLTVAVIALNAGAQIGACLASAQFADEILVVDSGSTDSTASIARSHGARVETKEWLGFGRQKQHAVAIARHDWVLCLDADERVSAELARSIGAALATDRYRAYRMARRNRFLGRWLGHGEGYPDWTVRLFHRAHASWSNDDVHEAVLTTA